MTHPGLFIRSCQGRSEMEMIRLCSQYSLLNQHSWLIVTCEHGLHRYMFKGTAFLIYIFKKQKTSSQSHFLIIAIPLLPPFSLAVHTKSVFIAFHILFTRQDNFIKSISSIQQICLYGILFFIRLHLLHFLF